MGPKPLARGSKREAILGPSSGPRPGRLTGGQVWGVGGYTPPGTTQAVPAVQLVWGVPPTTNGSSLGDFPRNSPGGVSPYFKKGWGWPGGPGDSGGGLGPGRGRFHIGKVDFSARAHPPERTAPRPKKLHVRTRTYTYHPKSGLHSREAGPEKLKQGLAPQEGPRALEGPAGPWKHW